MSTKSKTIAAIASDVVACGLSQSGHASPNLVVNGDFESTTHGVGELGYNTDLSSPPGTGWTYLTPNNSYDFIFNASSQDVHGNVAATGKFGSISLYAPASTSPSGGNFLAVDPGYENNGTLNQTINGLIVGDTYTVSFYWAAAQEAYHAGATTEGWDVSLGGGTPQDTTIYNLPNGAFSGWMLQTYSYTATSTSEVLSFLAAGTSTPTQPAFDLLDGVSLVNNSVTDSSSTAGLLGFGVAAMGIAAGCRRFCRA